MKHVEGGRRLTGFVSCYIGIISYYIEQTKLLEKMK